MRIPEGCNYTPIKMRILLDAKDLIDIVEHGRPISVEGFGEWLREKGATAVLSFININDFVGPTFENNIFLDMRLLLQRIETLPLSYIRRVWWGASSGYAIRRLLARKARPRFAF
jgi:hypothetical protein